MLATQHLSLISHLQVSFAFAQRIGKIHLFQSVFPQALTVSSQALYNLNHYLIPHMTITYYLTARSNLNGPLELQASSGVLREALVVSNFNH